MMQIDSKDERRIEKVKGVLPEYCTSFKKSSNGIHPLFLSKSRKRSPADHSDT